jgi:hypothetical protein
MTPRSSSVALGCGGTGGGEDAFGGCAGRSGGFASEVFG